MSTVPTPEKPADDKPTKFDDAPRKSSGVLRIVLILILLVAAGLGLLDLYSRNASNAAFAKVEEWVNNPSKGDKTPQDVHKLIGRQPDRPIEDKGEYFIEEYSWPRGRLYDTYYVKVLYAKGDEDQPELHEVVQNVEPEGGDLPTAPPQAADLPQTVGDEGGEAGNGEGDDIDQGGGDNATGEDASEADGGGATGEENGESSDDS